MEKSIPVTETNFDAADRKLDAAKHTLLLESLLAFEFDEADTRSRFAARLARENEWSSEYTNRVLVEYKRFVYLAAVSGHPVAPSDAVDQAWHLHLLYTRSYWDELCGKVLRMKLHHEPSRGGREESNKLTTWYSDTLASYRRCFGDEPPIDIWPPSPPRKSMRRIDVSNTLILPLPTKRVRMIAAAVLIILVGWILFSFR